MKTILFFILWVVSFVFFALWISEPVKETWPIIGSSVSVLIMTRLLYLNSMNRDKDNRES